MCFLEVFQTDVNFLSQIPLLFKYLLILYIPGCNTVSGFVFIQEEITFYSLEPSTTKNWYAETW